MNISELDTLQSIDRIGDEYEARFGAPPFNLSHWDPSPETSRLLTEGLVLPELGDLMPYSYAYDLECQEQLRTRLALPLTNRRCLVVPNGTSAVVFAATWLTRLNVKRVLVLCPAYFSVFYACDLLGIATSKVYLRRDDGRWSVPIESIATEAMKDRTTAVWITNPVYCTGVHLNSSMPDAIASLAQSGVPVVLDECLASQGLQVGPHVPPDPIVLALYSPHKAVCVNSLKFAVVVYNTRHERFFCDWTDVLIGGLSISNLVAVQHFLSDNFAEFSAGMRAIVQVVRERVSIVLGESGGVIETDRDCDGYFQSCYVPRLANESTEEELRRFTMNTGVLIIPGSRNHFPPTSGLSFRLNLARGSRQFHAAFGRTVAHFSAQ